MPTDEELVALAVAGDRSAYVALIERHQQRLLRFLGTRAASHADAEDALQDTFLSAYRHLAGFNPRWRFSTWLYRIAIRNLANMNRHRSGQQSHNGNETFDDDSIAHSSTVQGDDPLARCIPNDERENVWMTARQLLSDNAFNAMWLRYIEDMSIAEVACAMERRVSWTKVTLFRSRARLVKALSDLPTESADTSQDTSRSKSYV